MRSRDAALLSLAIHALLAFGLSQMPRFEPYRPPPFALELAAPTEQEKQDARKALEKGQRQVVRQTELPEKMKAKEKAERKARFRLNGTKPSSKKRARGRPASRKTARRTRRARALGFLACRPRAAKAKNPMGAADASEPRAST